MFWLWLLFAFALGALIATVIFREKNVRLAERLAALTNSREQVSNEFRALAADALNRNNEQFLHLAESTLERKRSAVDDMVKPLKSSLEKVDAQIQAMELQRHGAYSTLSQQVRQMAETQVRLSDETRRLVEALRTPAARGRWGEVQLRRVVEIAGMLAHCDFTEQETLNSEGGRLRPDLVVRLPNDKRIVVDSKVPLKAYLESLEEQTEAGRAAKLKEHALQIRRHLRSLGEKAYWSQFQPAPEFAIAFLPGEIFFSAALQQDPELIEFGVAQNIILATPTTLIALLKAVCYGWRQEQFAQNANQILELGCTLYERIRVFTEHYNEIGKSLNRAAAAYHKGSSSLETRLLSTARRFEDLGVSKGAGIPDVYTGDMPRLVPEEPAPIAIRAG
ncbi:MAG: DNA recombination protein RmuC [Acidobacteriota bacterium]|nr:DNA recombination protein RmuC [Acidobacteriota bacterium]